jgi:hypothetical protein
LRKRHEFRCSVYPESVVALLDKQCEIAPRATTYIKDAPAAREDTCRVARDRTWDLLVPPSHFGGVLAIEVDSLRVHVRPIVRDRRVAIFSQSAAACVCMPRRTKPSSVQYEITHNMPNAGSCLMCAVAAVGAACGSDGAVLLSAGACSPVGGGLRRRLFESEGGRALSKHNASRRGNSRVVAGGQPPHPGPLALRSRGNLRPIMRATRGPSLGHRWATWPRNAEARTGRAS